MELNLSKIFISICSTLFGEGLTNLLPEGFDIAGWPFIIIGAIGLFYYGLIDPIFNKLGWIFYPKWSFEFDSLWPFVILVPLERATQIAYTQLRHTLVTAAADHFDEKALDYYSTAFGTAGMDFYGKRNLSSVVDRIPYEDVKSGKFQDSSLISKVDNKKPWVSVKVERKQLLSFIKERKSAYKNDPAR